MKPSRMTNQHKKWMVWTGRVLTTLVVAMMLFSASAKLSHQPKYLEMLVGKFGFPLSVATYIGVLELACVVLYLIPQTAVLGAILLTAYLGGAVVTHVRVQDSWLAPVVIGIVTWAGLYLRDARLWALVPLRTNLFQKKQS